METFDLGDELESALGRGCAMSRVDIEFLGAHQHILRIGGFKNGDSPGTEDPDGFIE